MNLLPIITVRYKADGVTKKEKEKKQKKITYTNITKTKKNWQEKNTIKNS